MDVPFAILDRGDASTPSPRRQRPCYDIIICGDIVTVHRPQRITSARADPIPIEIPVRRPSGNKRAPLTVPFAGRLQKERGAQAPHIPDGGKQIQPMAGERLTPRQRGGSVGCFAGLATFCSEAPRKTAAPAALRCSCLAQKVFSAFRRW